MQLFKKDTKKSDSVKEETIYKVIEPAQYTKKLVKIDIEPYETFKVHDLANMFPFNITPAMIESKIQHLLAVKQRMFNSLTPQMGFLIIALIIAGVLAAVIAWKFLGGGSQEVIVKLGPGLESLGATIQTNLTG